MTYMRSWRSHRLTSHTWLSLNPQIGRPLSRIVGAIGLWGGGEGRGRGEVCCALEDLLVFDD
jgi:hypothetical protein